MAFKNRAVASYSKISLSQYCNNIFEKKVQLNFHWRPASKNIMRENWHELMRVTNAKVVLINDETTILRFLTNLRRSPKGRIMKPVRLFDGIKIWYQLYLAKNVITTSDKWLLVFTISTLLQIFLFTVSSVILLALCPWNDFLKTYISIQSIETAAGGTVGSG